MMTRKNKVAMTEINVVIIWISLFVGKEKYFSEKHA